MPRPARSGPATPPWGRKPALGLRITVIGLGPLQEACLAGMLALALSWGSAELLFRLAQAPEPGPKAIVSAAMQP
ncbi:MAG: hypothetical protein EON47_10860 [Acetobacteraceae bacterium]|nr:MAG: hypothetical protein EON47_10860 [Acetobacteraceae bacterium]